MRRFPTGVNSGEPSKGLLPCEIRLRVGVEGVLHRALAGDGIRDMTESATTGRDASSSGPGVEGSGNDALLGNEAVRVMLDREDLREREGSTFSLEGLLPALRLLPSFLTDFLRASFSAGGSGGFGPQPGANRGIVAVSVFAHFGSTNGFLFSAGVLVMAPVEGPATAWVSSCDEALRL